MDVDNILKEVSSGIKHLIHKVKDRYDTYFDYAGAALAAACVLQDIRAYRATSPIRKRHPIGPYLRPMPRVLGGS